ncbi:chemotaxis response regulator protein-glutamate methylesterase [Candidatus Sumerlaeota bacterium]|nr:chemotaxis response regulator protein-glutamate methylesterase [Candidatus Sumerlaeota bacterium]
MSDRPVRVLVVDDSALYRKVLAELLMEIRGVEVVGRSANGKLALESIPVLRPDLLTLDLEMPEIDGLGVLEVLRVNHPEIGAIMLSSHTHTGADATMRALELGAFDFVPKPTASSLQQGIEQIRSDLVPKVEAFAQSLRSSARPAESLRSASPEVRVPTHTEEIPPSDLDARPKVIALGISTGGPNALAKMMPRLPVNLPVPLLIVQHMPPVFTKSLADSLNAKCAIEVREAREGEPIRPATALIAPGGKQMKISRPLNGGEPVVRLTNDPPENNCRPSVDYLYRSVSYIFGPRALAVIMTGMGSDGLDGARLLKRRGARVIAQDEASSTIYGMPRAVIEEGLADAIIPLDEISSSIQRVVGGV